VIVDAVFAPRNIEPVKISIITTRPVRDGFGGGERSLAINRLMYLKWKFMVYA
jgi:hypothetical protein